jgi:hypothetical protein
MNRLALILLLAAPVFVADPAVTSDRGVALSNEASEADGSRSAEWTAQLDDVRLALRAAEAERDKLKRENAALLAAIEHLKATIVDLQKQLDDCLSPPPEIEPLYAFSGTTSNPLRAKIREAGLEVPIFYHLHMDPKVTGTIDPERLRGYVRSRIVDAAFDGLVCLDMEGPYTQGLLAKIGGPEWTHTIEQMALAADIVKEERPKAKIAYWGLPSLWCWGWEDGERRKWLDCRPETRQKVIDRWCAAQLLIARIDWFTPCAYEYYPVDKAFAEDAMVRDWLPFQAMVCKAMKPRAPILWSVSPRCHNALHPDWDLSLVPPEEIYLDQIRPALEHGNGIIWWGADEYYYGKGKIPADEIEPGLPYWKAWRTHFEALHTGQWEMFQRMVADPAGGDDR